MEVNEVVFFIYMYYFQTYFNLAMKYIIGMFGGQLAIDEIEKYINRWKSRDFIYALENTVHFLHQKCRNHTPLLQIICRQNHKAYTKPIMRNILIRRYVI